MAFGSAGKRVSGVYEAGPGLGKITMDSQSVDGSPSHIPVEGLGYDPSQKLQRSLTPRLDEQEESRLANRIIIRYFAALSDRTEWENRLEEWENAYYNRTPDKDFPWQGAANFHVPITTMGVETYKPRLVEGVLGQIPPVMVIPTRGTDEDRKDVVEQFLNWQVLTQLKLEQTVFQSAHLFMQPGLAIAKTYWKVERVWRKFIREFPMDTPLDTIMEALFSGEKPQDLQDDGENKWSLIIPTSPQAGGPLQVYLTLNHITETDPPVLQVLVEREQVTERPQVDLIEPIDLVVPIKGGQDIDELPWVVHRIWMMEEELRQKARMGRFYPDAVEDLLTSGPPRGDQPMTDSQNYRQAMDATEGVQGQGPSNVRRMQWAILECYMRWDIDGDGVDEEIIVWTSHHARRRLLGWDYLDNVYAHGRRPIRVGRFHPIPFRFYGLSFAELVKGIQDEINTIHNQRVDYATLQNMPFYVKRASASIPPIRQILKPGEGIEVDNPATDIIFPRIQGSPTWGQQEEAILMQHFERLTGLTDLAIGKQPNRVGATRTASGTQTLLSESGLRFKGALNSFQRFWTGIFDDILALDQEYLPPNTEFRVTGRFPTTVQIKDRMEIRGRYDLHLASSTETMNRQRMREDSGQVLQVIMNPSLMQGGVVGMKGVRRAVQDYLKAFGREPYLYLEDQAPPRSPVEELQLFVGGQYIAPVMGENIQEHLATHQDQMRAPLTPEQRAMLIKHVQETLQLQQTQQMQMMLQQTGPPQVGRQATNAQTGAAQPQAANNNPTPQPTTNTGAVV